MVPAAHVVERLIAMAFSAEVSGYRSRTRHGPGGCPSWWTLRMSDHATTIANAVARLNSGDVDGYIEGLYHPHCRFQLPDTFGSDRRGDLGWSDALRSGAVEVTGALAPGAASVVHAVRVRHRTPAELVAKASPSSFARPSRLGDSHTGTRRGGTLATVASSSQS